MTLEERVARLEQRADQFDRIEQRLGRIEQRLESVQTAVTGLRTDFNEYRNENAAVLGRILATLENMQRQPIVFRWPWEHA
jgi:chromosome segregation ATPase